MCSLKRKNVFASREAPRTAGYTVSVRNVYTHNHSCPPYVHNKPCVMRSPRMSAGTLPPNLENLAARAILRLAELWHTSASDPKTCFRLST